MVPSARTLRSVMLSERLLLMRLITSIGLTLLLMWGVAAAGHAEGEGVGAHLAVANAELPPHAPSGAGSEHRAFAEPTSSRDALEALALCALGVLCGLVFTVLIRVRRQYRPVPHGRRPRLVREPAMRLIRTRMVTLTLPELSVFRI